jgi:hypothetical protein
MKETDETMQDQVALIQPDDLDDVDRLLATAEKMSRNLTKLKKYALTLTKPKDWCLFGETLHMRVQAAEDIASKVGISWPSVDQTGSQLIIKEKINIANGHYAYIYSGEFWWFGRRITAQGKAASNKPFFAKRGDEIIPADEVDEPNVMQAAYSNLIVNGVRRVTGLHNVDLDDLKEHINIEAIPKVSFKEEFKKAPMDESGKKQIEWLNQFLTRLVGDEVDKKQAWLEKETTWKNKEGKQIPGKKSLKDLSVKQIPFVYRNAMGQLAKNVGERAKAIFPDKATRDKELIVFSSVELGDGEVEVGISAISNMSASALCQVYDRLLNVELDQQAAKDG